MWFNLGTCREKPKAFDTVEDMEKWLSKNGGENLRESVKTWGQIPGTKPLSALHQEMNNGETALELWSKKNGVSLIVRVVHVFRGKIMSHRIPGAFLFNTYETLLPKIGAGFGAAISTGGERNSASAPPSSPREGGLQERKIPRNLFITEKLILNSEGNNNITELLEQTAHRIIGKRIQKLFPEDFDLSTYLPVGGGAFAATASRTTGGPTASFTGTAGAPAESAKADKNSAKREGSTTKGPDVAEASIGAVAPVMIPATDGEKDHVEEKHDEKDNPLLHQEPKKMGPIRRASIALGRVPAPMELPAQQKIEQQGQPVFFTLIYVNRLLFEDIAIRFVYESWISIDV